MSEKVIKNQSQPKTATELIQSLSSVWLIICISASGHTWEHLEHNSHSNGAYKPPRVPRVKPTRKVHYFLHTDHCVWWSAASKSLSATCTCGQLCPRKINKYKKKQPVCLMELKSARFGVIRGLKTQWLPASAQQWVACSSCVHEYPCDSTGLNCSKKHWDCKGAEVTHTGCPHLPSATNKKS